MLTHTAGTTLKLYGAPPIGHRVLTLADVSAATLVIYDIDGTTALFTKTLYVSAEPSTGDYSQCMFATAQTDANWPHASGGYTFFAQVTVAEYALVAGSTYKAVATLAAGTSSPTWPDMTDYGDVVIEFPFHVEAA